jgi:KUP system potassium uptake protein
LIDRYLSQENYLPAYQKFIFDIYYLIKNISFREERAFGIDSGFVEIEHVPLVLNKKRNFNIKRVEE